MLTLALVALGVGPLPGPASAHLAHGALKRHCARCHDGTGPDRSRGKFGFVLDLHALSTRGLVQPILDKVRTGEMPPGSQKVPAADAAALRAWAEAGAPAIYRYGPPQPPAAIQRAIQADLAALPERERPHVRYLTLGHLGDGPEARALRLAVSKLANSLSWHPRLTRPHEVTPLILRLDLRDYRWPPRVWEKLASLSPYREAEGHPLRADWFVATASRPPMYHDFLRLPLTARALERMAGADLASARAEDRAARAGFTTSGVARFNRVLERIDGLHGCYWQSHDFSENSGRQNIFESPTTFRPAGGEIIFRLPNGLHGYMIVDGDGQRIDRAPGEIVQDPNRPDRLVENGLSCIGCHATGIHPKDDQVREHVLAHRKSFEARVVEGALALYPPARTFRKLVDEDNARFRRALEALAVSPTGPEPVLSAVQRYERALDRSALAAELGLRPEELPRLLEKTPDLGRALAAGKHGTVSRDLFEQLYSRLTDAGPATAPTAPLASAHKGAVTAVAISSRHLASGGADGKLFVYPRDGGKPVLAAIRTEEVRAVALSPDGKAIASAAGRTVQVHSTSGKLLATLTGHTAPVRAVAFLPGGRLVSAGEDRTARVWEVSARKCLAELVGHAGVITCLAASEDGKSVVTGSADRSVRWWDVQTGACLGMREGDAPIHAVAWAKGKVAGGASNGKAWLWSLADKGDARLLAGPEGTIRALHVTDGGAAAAISARGPLTWRWNPGATRPTTAGTGPVGTAAFSADGRVAVVGGEAVKVVEVSE
jgi:hypothetical protein